MRLFWICLLGIPVFGQLRLGVGMPGIRGPQPVARASPTAQRHWNGYGYWQWGRAGWDATPPVVIAQTPPEAKAPILASSSLYQPDRAQPVMREYGGSPSPLAAPLATVDRIVLVAFRDGRVEAVRAYWVANGQFAYVTQDDAVRKVALASVDLDRSERLNRQPGVDSPRK